MKERPIIFSASMIKALLAGKKTQTRRIITPQPFEDGDLVGHARLVGRFGAHVFGTCLVTMAGSPYGSVGDRLWVKETHQFAQMSNETIVVYRAGCEADSFTYVDPSSGTIEQIEIRKWKPAIFMRRLESRITLAITKIRAERLHDVTEDDAKAEGVTPFLERYSSFSADQRIDGDRVDEKPFRTTFVCLWDEINGDRALFSSNPWVWVVEFEMLDDAAKEAA